MKVDSFDTENVPDALTDHRFIGSVIIPADTPPQSSSHHIASALTKLVNMHPGKVYIYAVHSSRRGDDGFVVLTEPNIQDVANQCFEALVCFDMERRRFYETY